MMTYAGSDCLKYISLARVTVEAKQGFLLTGF